MSVAATRQRPATDTTKDEFAMPDQSTVERFWEKVDKSGECWIWTGYTLPTGYGQITERRFGKVRVHRLSYEIAFGPIAPGLHVCHRCDNPPCVRPDHLFLGTDADNLHDMAAKGRRAETAGEGNGNARLTAEEVTAIRTAGARGVSSGVLAETYGMSYRAIRDILTRRRWASVA